MDYNTGKKDVGELFDFSRITSSKLKKDLSQCTEGQTKVAGSSRKTQVPKRIIRGWQQGQVTQKEYRDTVQVCSDGVRYTKTHLETNLAGNLQGSQPHLNPWEGNGANNLGTYFQKYERQGGSSQHAFMKQKSGLTNLIAFYDEITSSVDEGSTADIFILTLARFLTLSPITFS